ncbi:hypothetical protein AB4Y78_11535 [Janibacter sp. RAF52]|uniref:hypothetical protein n=1 Tax=unclassified Janibacter TaxID=2649294 RepID=UPI003F91EBC8
MDALAADLRGYRQVAGAQVAAGEGGLPADSVQTILPLGETKPAVDVDARSRPEAGMVAGPERAVVVSVVELVVTVSVGVVVGSVVGLAVTVSVRAGGSCQSVRVQPASTRAVRARASAGWTTSPPPRRPTTC